jgi:hypothetical protein
VLRLFSSPGISPISGRKLWAVPSDVTQFWNEVHFKQVDDDENEEVIGASDKENEEIPDNQSINNN